MSELLPLLKEVAIFKDLRVTEQFKIAEKMEKQAFLSGERLCEEGMPGGDAMYIIESGYVNVVIRGVDQKTEKNLATLGPAASFGELSFLTGESHTASIVAISSGVLYKISRADFNFLLKEIPAIGLSLSKVVSKKFVDTLQLEKGVARFNRVISIVSPEKGVGKSTLLANLAAALAEQTGKKIIAIDLNYSPGSLASILNLSTPIGLHAFIQSGDEFSFATIDAATVRHPCGINVLGILPEYRAEAVSGGFIQRLIDILKEVYDFVFIEIPCGEPQMTLQFTSASDVVILQTSSDPKLLAKSVDYLKFLREKMPEIDKKIKLIIQQKYSGDLVDRGSIEKSLRVKISEVLPSDGTLADTFSICATPFVVSHPQATLSKIVSRFARELGGKKIGLALSAGMAPGMAHIGVLKVLLREKLPIDIISGTSGGAMFAAACALGIPISEIEKMALDFARKFIWFYADFNAVPFSGLLRGTALQSFINRIFKNYNFGDLSIPLKIVAVDLQNGDPVILDEGNIARAVRASISVPGLLSPVEIGKRLLVDGAAVSPVPVSVLQQSGANLVIAVNVNSPLNDQSSRPNIFDVVMQGRAISAYRMAELDSARAEIVIKPETSDFKWRDYNRAEEIIERGEAAAEKALGRIREGVAAR